MEIRTPSKSINNRKFSYFLVSSMGTVLRSDRHTVTFTLSKRSDIKNLSFLLSMNERQEIKKFLDLINVYRSVSTCHRCFYSIFIDSRLSRFNTTIHCSLSKKRSINKMSVLFVHLLNSHLFIVFYRSNWSFPIDMDLVRFSLISVSLIRKMHVLTLLFFKEIHTLTTWIICLMNKRSIE